MFVCEIFLPRSKIGVGWKVGDPWPFQVRGEFLTGNSSVTGEL